MTNLGYAYQYTDEILHRNRVGMEPANYAPDWGDQPRDQKFFPHAERIPLPIGEYPADGRVQDALQDGGTSHSMSSSPVDLSTAFDIETLGGMLFDSYGLAGRRLAVHANDDMPELPSYPAAKWSRGTASGGGLYPVSVYWVAGPSSPLVPGIYYYSPGQHWLEQLVTGDVTAGVRESLGADSLPAHDQFLVLGVKYWQNAFKYNSFAFHAVTMDIGTVLASWRLWAVPRGLAIDPVLWFDEQRLGEVLGVDGQDEGLFAVVPLTWSGTRRPHRAELAHPPTISHVDRERSRTVRRFAAVEKMQWATFSASSSRPSEETFAEIAAESMYPQDTDGSSVRLPPARVLDVDVRSALRRRRSSFGRFEATRRTEADALAAVLGAASATRIDRPFSTDPVSLVTLYVFVNHVEDVEPGAYRYDPIEHRLVLIADGQHGRFLQQNYFLGNYNLEQAGAVLVPAMRIEAVLDAVGDRGYLLVNATIGALAQSMYTACAALDLGCGAALGFDNISYMEQLGLAGTDEAPLLITMIGHERGHSGDYRYQLV